jgi:hypothetical protein
VGSGPFVGFSARVWIESWGCLILIRFEAGVKKGGSIVDFHDDHIFNRISIFVKVDAPADPLKILNFGKILSDF